MSTPRSITERYKGRRITVRKARTYGHLEVLVNGQIIGTPYGRMDDPIKVDDHLAILRANVDSADERPDAYGEYFRRASAR